MNTIMKISGVFLTLSLFSCTDSIMNLSEKIELNKNWLVQQSSEINLPGSVISGRVVDTAGWYKAAVPSTIMGVLTGNGLFNDVFMGDSLSRISREPFRKSWWYRKEFRMPELGKDQHVELCFDGISYYANIWLNSKLVASRDSVFGTYRTFTFDITELVKDVNVLAVEVFKRKPGDFGHGYVDWNPAPPDESMGIWRGVFLRITGDVAISHTFVRTDALSPDLDEALMSVNTELINYSSRAVSGKLAGKSGEFEFSIPVHLKGREKKIISLTHQDVRSLRVVHPRLWWCNNLGEPNLYKMNLQFITNKAVSDEQEYSFGIRKIETFVNAAGHKGFKLNGRELLIQGGGWTDDIFMRDTPEQNEIQVQYTRHMNLNTIRFENIWGTSRHIYEMCDRYGILAMVGWSCQWEWDNYLGKKCDEYGGIKTKEEMDLIVESLGDQIRYLQNHPSVFVWLLGSDKLPRPALETRYRDLITGMDDRPYLASASARTSKVSGTTGMKMNGPYEYVSPAYWYLDSVNGGAFGFNTETGPGPQIPVRETLMRMIPKDKLWPVNEVWNYHCTPAKEAFNNLDVLQDVLQQRYGKPGNLENFLMKSDVLCYEAMKGMFEAFRVNRPATTGIIQWMLNSAWPSFYWQLYDYYLLPTSAYYASRKANAPLQLIYNYGNNQLVAVNGTLNRYERLRAGIRLTDMSGKVVLSEEKIISPAENSTLEFFRLPPLKGTLFLSLTLNDDNGVKLADNFYWLSGKPDEYAWENTTWYYTPLKASADFRSLNYLPVTEVVVDMKKAGTEDESIEVALTNNSGRVAFFLNLTIRDREGNTVFPVFWDDNYLCLLPGESRSLRCRLPGSLPAGKPHTLTVSGWNCKEQIIPIAL